MYMEGQKFASTFKEKVAAKNGQASVVLPEMDNTYYYLRIGDPNKNLWAISGNFNIIKPGETPKQPVAGSSDGKSNPVAGKAKKSSASALAPVAAAFLATGAAVVALA
jgi:hypothetical protein